MKPAETLQYLKDYFTARRDVVMAFLFGSEGTGRAGSDSDVDVAVYFDSEAKGRWMEHDREFPEEFKLTIDLERILGRKVDLLILNRASPVVADSALRGAPLLIRDRRVFLDYLFRVTSEAADFREFVESWWRMKQERSHDVAAGR